MRELPILLNGEMVRATIDGRKTQTRRPVKLAEGLEAYHIDEWRSIDGHDLWQPWGDCGMCNGAMEPKDYGSYRNPLGVPGDLLYVREAWVAISYSHYPRIYVAYRASTSLGPPALMEARDVSSDFPWSKAKGYVERRGPRCWRPSIHMPKWAARTWLRVTDVRIERVQDIIEEDAFAEGITDGDWLGDPVGRFAEIWNSIYGKKGLGWSVNPWCWVTSYEVIER